MWTALSMSRRGGKRLRCNVPVESGGEKRGDDDVQKKSEGRKEKKLP